jgi:hypothetical protein
MWTTLKVFLSGALKKIVDKLLPWLKTEVAAFIADYLDDAVIIVGDVAKRSDLSNSEKFKLAKEMLVAELMLQKQVYKENRLNALIEIALSVYKEKKSE